MNPRSKPARWQLHVKRLGREGLDLLELVLLPGLAAVLPWRVAFALFGRMARWGWLYAGPTEAALAQARAHGWGGEDEAHWRWQRNLITLVDHADHYLGMSRGPRWMARHLQVRGQWPTLEAGAAPFVLATFHWGAGYWGLRHAAAAGLQAHALVASLDRRWFAGRTVLWWYARARTAHVARVLGAPTLEIQQSMKPVLRAFGQGRNVLSVLDVPADQADAALPVQVLGLTLHVPRAMLRYATQQGIGFCPYITGLDTRTGQRWIEIGPLQRFSGPQEAANAMFGVLERHMAAQAPAWHFWGELPRFMAMPPR